MPLRPTLVLALCLAGCTTRPDGPPPRPADPAAEPDTESVTETVGSAPGTSDASPGERGRIDRWQTLNSACRGGSGDDPATMQACDAREAASDSLEALGWCYGESGQAGFEMEWHRCTSP